MSSGAAAAMRKDLSLSLPTKLSDSSTSRAPSPSAIRASAAAKTQREVEFAELEVRIRKFSMELVQPTLRKVALLEHGQSDLQTEAAKTAEAIAALKKMGSRVDQQVAVVEGFQEELGRWDNERRQFQADAAESMSAMRQELDAFRYQLERQDCSIHSVQRTIDRVVGELSKVQEGWEALRQYVERRLEQQSSLVNTKTTDLEVKLVQLEARHNRLSDDLWGEETGLAKVAHDLALTNDLVNTHSEEVKNMRQDKANVVQLEAVQEEVNNLKHEAYNNIQVLRETVNTMIGNVKSHFSTATNTVAAHNAAMIQEVRTSYQEELGQSAKLRKEIMSFMQDAQQKMTQLEDTLATSQEKTGDLVKRVSTDVDELNRLRRRERSNAEVEAKSMHEQLTSVGSSAANVSKGLEHLSSVLWMLLQSERASSAMDQQDANDRGKVALMGYREHKGTGSTSGSGGSRAASGGATPRTRGKSKGPAAGDHATSGPVISVDHRCLSCSGQAQNVLQGFKMACLQYTPGKVNFAKKNYERADLLELREKLLGQAHEALQHGPVASAVVSAELPDPKEKAPALRDAVGLAHELTSREDCLESRSSLASTCLPTPGLPPLTARTISSR